MKRLTKRQKKYLKDLAEKYVWPCGGSEGIPYDIKWGFIKSGLIEFCNYVCGNGGYILTDKGKEALNENMAR